MMKATNRNVWIALLVGAVLLGGGNWRCGSFPRKRHRTCRANGRADSRLQRRTDKRERRAGRRAEKRKRLKSVRVWRSFSRCCTTIGEPVSNPKIREWLEWYGNKLIVEGEEDGDIVGALDSSLWDLREIADPKELERRIEDSRENALYDYEDDYEDDEGLQYSENFSEKKNRIQRFLYDLYGHLRYPGPDEKTPRRGDRHSGRRNERSGRRKELDRRRAG